MSGHLHALRSLVPATIVGVWSGVLWHAFVVELSLPMAGAFDVVTTLAVGWSAALAVFAIVYRAASPPLAAAHVLHWRQRIPLRALAVFAIVTLLAVIDRTIVRVPVPIEIIEVRYVYEGGAAPHRLPAAGHRAQDEAWGAASVTAPIGGPIPSN